MRSAALLAVLWLTSLPSSGPVLAQGRLTLEVRGGAGIPVTGFRAGPVQGGDIGAGPAFGVHFALRRNRWMDLYAGFSQLRFGCEAEGCVDAETLVSTIWNVGAHVRVRPGLWGPWFRLGLVAGATEPESAGSEGDASGGTLDVTETGFGGEVGVGWRLRLTDAWGLSPGIRYALWNARSDEETEFRMRYWVADIGVILAF